MSTVEQELTNTAKSITFDSSQWEGSDAYRSDAYHCHVCLIHDEEGTISALVLNLPGAGSCGATEEEALANVQEAVRGIIESYEMDGKAIPWQDSDLDDVPDGAKLTWILVNAK